LEKINYVIATWSGDRRINNKKYLKNHILKLLSLKHNLTQITIVKPLLGGDNSYYDFKELIDEFKCKVVILDRESNQGQSYGQLFYAYEQFKDEFDYYIFIEDDYHVNIDNFDTILKDLYNNKIQDGYLCSYSGFNDEYPNGGCSVSNGIISSKTLSKIYSLVNNPSEIINNSNGSFCHKNFTDLLIRCGIYFKDFASEYRVPYFGTNIIEYGRTDTTKSIFVPYQLFDLNLKFRKIESTDIPKFLEIRNVSKEFLHNNSEFTLDDANNWFNTYNPNFYMIELGDNVIGYFRTSNWENKSMYLGCDLSPKYRGYGLAYISYINFINKLNNEFDLDYIKLEVLSTNFRAKNLYDKLGFKTIGVSSEKIIRNGEEINSIIMELKL
jgi:RimJ/RimL family protein N-acetyltransferase